MGEASSRPIQFPPHYLEKLIEVSPDIVIAVDRQGTIVFYNDGAEKNLGYSAAEILGQPVTRIYPSADEAHRVMTAMRGEESGGPGKVKNFETIFVDRWGQSLPVAISGSILCDEVGFEIGSIGFAKDMREIRRRDRLATLGEVAVAVCHEINNPLEAIVNQVELLDCFVRETAREERLDSEAVRVETIRGELRKIQRIVNRLVDLARGAQYSTVEYHEGTRMADLSSNRQEAGLAGLRILVVDDDVAVATSVSELLRREGCQVEMAHDGLAGLRRFEAGRFDAVVSDVVMPDLDGYDLYMEIRKRGDVPVILMTGYYFDRDHVIKRSRLEGLQNVLFKKPVDPERLKGVLREVTHRSRPAAATGTAGA